MGERALGKGQFLVARTACFKSVLAIGLVGENADIDPRWDGLSGDETEYSKDIDLLISQTKRCSEILKKISRKQIEEDQFTAGVHNQGPAFNDHMTATDSKRLK